MASVRLAGSAVVLTLALSAACSTETDSADKSVPGPSPTKSMQSTSPTTTSTATTVPSATAVDACLESQRKALRRMTDRLYRPEMILLGSANGTSPRAARLLSAISTRVRALVAQGCKRLPPAMGRYLDAVRRHSRSALEIEGMRAVYRAAIHWASTVGTRAADLRRELRGFNFCHQLGHRLDASYRIWWRWTESGKAWWIEMTYDNRTEWSMWASLGGSAYATHLLSSETDRPGSSMPLSWGGSSADIAKIRRGISSQLVGIGYVDTSSAGTLVVREAGVGVQVPRRVSHTYPIGCSIPVSQH